VRVEPSSARSDAAAGAVFAALADPTRRRVVSALTERETVTASSLAGELPMSRQAVAKHLALLDEVGLVAGERAGRETRYRLTPGPLSDAMAWMADAGARWDDRLARLQHRLEK
jgi:DNA-binding transcriptional ArsR family regulator